MQKKTTEVPKKHSYCKDCLQMSLFFNGLGRSPATSVLYFTFYDIPGMSSLTPPETTWYH
uniref:Uncharacterized protein n=1 Tax=Arundo donax TaxID=35708 RepID=A0A0A9EQ40_ARUDO